MLKIGDRVKINHNCCLEYWDITGIITNKLDAPDEENGYLINYVKFDIPLGTLEGEYFADRELQKLSDQDTFH